MSATELMQRLDAERKNIFLRMTEINDAAEKRADGKLTAEEDANFTRASQDMDALKARITQIEASERANRESEEMLTRALGAGNVGGSAPVHSDQQDEATQVRQFLNGLRRGGASEIDFRAADGSTGRRAQQSLRTGLPMQEARASGVLNKTTTTQGQYLVPTNLYDMLVKHLVASSAIMTAGATVLETSGGNPIDVPITTSHGSVSALTAEQGNLATNSTDPAFGKRTLSSYKYGQLVQVSRELLEDELFDIIPYIAEATGRNVGLALGSDLLVANGSSKPSGILQTSTMGVTGATSVAGVFTADNLWDLYFSVIAPYRASAACAWLVQDATLGTIRKLKDGAGRYLFDPGFNGAATVGAPDRLLGKPIYTDPFVPATGTTNKSVIFGDISRYFVRIAGGGVRFERSDEFAFGTDLVTFKAVIRADGVLVDQTGAVKHFLGGAT